MPVVTKPPSVRLGTDEPNWRLRQSFRQEAERKMAASDQAKPVQIYDSFGRPKKTGTTRHQWIGNGRNPT